MSTVVPAAGLPAAYARKARFLAGHPEWQVHRIYGADGYFEASTGDPDTGKLVIMADRSLNSLMDRLEAEYDT